MTVYALYIVDTQGNIVHEQPKGCQFDNAYVKTVYEAEKKTPAPHPIVSDMGEGFSMIGLFSGVQPFIILPNYIIGVVVDTKENPDEIKKQLRKLTNNILLHINDSTIDSYMEKLWGIVESGQWPQINLEKPTEIPNPNAKPQIDVKFNSTPSISPQSSPFNTSPAPSSPFANSTPKNSAVPSSEFNDLLSLSESQESPIIEQTPSSSKSSPKPSSADPFGGSSADPFGSNRNQDPFGSSSNRDPFGGSVPSSKPISNPPKSSPNLSDIDDILGGSEPKSTESKQNEFDSNPFGSVSPKGDSSVDEFSDNPWADDKPKKKEKDPDPFSENPF